MAITAENLRWHEFIGLRASVARSASQAHRGISGTVVDETKNTLVIRGKDGKDRRVPKRGSVFAFVLPDGKKAVLEGAQVAFRPYDRPKKVKGVV
ncbi:MAG: ribonuclease P protein subunit [Candidatus Micrarchaeota archaeon]|nr:ribonuclease P protein subunit [Candidatus Micrarchaeota archaeon]